jgi:hypothetical protein
VHNWRLNDGVTGYAPPPAADRRKQVLMIEEMSSKVFGNK